MADLKAKLIMVTITFINIQQNVSYELLLQQ